MNSAGIAVLINLLGWTVGLALYAMLLAISLRPFSGVAGSANHRGLFSGSYRADEGSCVGSYDALPLLTALLGLLWNAGALVTNGLHGFGVEANTPTPLLLVGAASVSALGFLPAVVVHSATTPLYEARRAASWARRLVTTAYALSSVAAVMHIARVFTTNEPSSTAALYILTGGFALLMANLLVLTRGEPNARRAVWAAALAVFAVSALHLSVGNTDSTQGRWYIELIGHHASLPLAFAILYQDYRFAFADIFLKRALNLLALLALIGGAFSVYVSFFAAPLVAGEAINSIRLDARSLSVLLAVWVGTALVYPWLGRASVRFVDKVVLRRVDYAELRVEVARLAHERESPAELLDDVCRRLRPALTAYSAVWRETELPEKGGAEKALLANVDENQAGSLKKHSTGSQPSRRTPNPRATAAVMVPTTDAPRYEISIGELAGGRRLLSDDIELLEAVSITIARRIDALRVTHERCEQVQREQEISKLATEAQLRALRAQINPHFLFNALTTIGYLIQTSPQRALETLLRLTDLLRRVLRASEEWTTLGEELKLIESYLDIERARFEERLWVRVDVPRELRELLVPSLVVQPIVENAIKHGITPLKAGGEIHITARSEGDMLIISVRDTGAGIGFIHLAEGRRDGVGLDNVEQRLRLCYGGEAELRFASNPGQGTSVELLLPIRQAHSAISVQGMNGDDKILSGDATSIINAVVTTATDVAHKATRSTEKRTR